MFQPQLLINQANQLPQQPTRILTPQGTIVTQNVQPSISPHHNLVQTNQNNGPLPQQNTINTSARSSPHPQQVQQVQQVQQIQQVKKVVVQPNNANDMDLEESITAAIVQKNPVTDTISIPEQFTVPPPQIIRQTHTPGLTPISHNSHNTVVSQHQLNFNTQHNFQQQQQQVTYEHPQVVQQPPQTISQLLMEPDNPEEERQIITLSNGQRISIAEYKRMHQSSRVLTQQQQQQQQQPR